MRSTIAVCAATAVLLIGASFGSAAPRIPSSELPGRERERFVDPPAARLLQQREPNTTLPYGARGPDWDCRVRMVRGKQRWRCAPPR